jgi:hypothetical protein
METGMYFVGNFIQVAAEQTDCTGKAKSMVAAARTGLRDLEAEPDEKIFG